MLFGEQQKTAAMDAIREIHAFNNPLMVVEIKEFVRNRTLAQNRLIHMWFGIIAKETGNDIEAIKAYYKQKFLGHEFKHVVIRRVGELAGDFDLVDKIVSQLKSTADLTTKEMTEFCEKVEADASSELGIDLPHPIDLYWAITGDFNEDDFR